MRYPKNLQKGGIIGFVAPSFGCATEPYKSAFLNAQKKFKEMAISASWARTAMLPRESVSAIRRKNVEKS